VWHGWHSISAKTHLVRGSMPCSLVSSAGGASVGEVGCLGIAVGPGTSVGPGDQCEFRGPVWVPATGDQCMRASRQHGSGHHVEQPGRCGSSGVAHGPWIDRERGRKSPTGRRCTFWPRGSGSISAQGGVDPSRISVPVCTEISEKDCARSRKPAFRDNGAWQRILRGRKVFTEAQLTGYPESEERFAWRVARLSRRRVGMEEEVVFGNYGSWRAEDWYKGLAPARCRYFSPQLT
jgi:hypothetical protein